MKNKKIGITILILFITITTSINIVSLNKSSKLLGTVSSRNINSNEVDYTENKSVQGAINDLAEKANIIGTDEEKNKFRDDSKTLIGQIGTDKLNTTSQNLTDAINEINSNLRTGLFSESTMTLNENISLYKRANIVFFSIGGKNKLYSSTSEGWKNIGTLPEEYRPREIVKFVVYENSSSTYANSRALSMFINTYGEVFVYIYADKLNVNPTGTVMYFTN